MTNRLFPAQLAGSAAVRVAELLPPALAPAPTNAQDITTSDQSNVTSSALAANSSTSPAPRAFDVESFPYSSRQPVVSESKMPTATTSYAASADANVIALLFSVAPSVGVSQVTTRSRA